jgi:heptosyltransferase I
MVEIGKNDFKNILIIKPSAAGDIISALPVLSALKARFPEAKISWLVASHLADLLWGHPMIDDVIEFERRRFGYLARSWTVARRFWAFLTRLRRSRFDLVIDLQGLFRSGFFAWITRAPVRIGPSETRELGWVFYTHRIPALPRDTHIVDRLAAVGELLSLDLAQPKFNIHLTDSAREKINTLLLNNLTPGKFIVLAPGGTWASKRWPAEKFAQLAVRIITELNLPVVLIGGRAELPLVAAFPQNPKLVNIIGQTGLPDLLALLAVAKALVCNDSGPMHMAVALDKPVTAIIGPTNPARTGPYRRPHGVVKSAQSCSPCYRRRCNLVAPLAPALCMQEISVDAVFENLKTQL